MLGGLAKEAVCGKYLRGRRRRILRSRECRGSIQLVADVSRGAKGMDCSQAASFTPRMPGLDQQSMDRLVSGIAGRTSFDLAYRQRQSQMGRYLNGYSIFSDSNGAESPSRPI